jgi:hypothetical protein
MTHEEVETYLAHCSADEAKAYRERQGAELKELFLEIRRNETFLRAEGVELETYYDPNAIVLPEPQPTTQTGAN